MKTTAAWTVLILAIIAAATTRVSCHEGPAGRKVQLPSVREVGTEIAVCLDSVVGTGGCVRDLLTSLVTLQFRLGPDCCKAISGVDDHCFKPIFASFPFVPDVISLAKSFCHAVPSEKPLPTVIPPTATNQ